MSDMIYKMQGKIDDSKLSGMERFLLARFCYRNGIEYWSDAEYDEFFAKMQRVYPNNRYVLTSYDDDTVFPDLLEKAGFTDDDIYHFSNQVRADCSDEESAKYREEMLEGVSKGITGLFTLAECYDAAKALAGKELCISLKVDGIRVKALYQKQPSEVQHTYKFATTRGQALGTVPVNITRNVSRILPKSFKTDIDVSNVLIDGECFCYEDAIDYINAKYNTDLKVPRSAGMSMIRTTGYEDSDYQYVAILVHGINLGRTVSEGYEIAEMLGFETVPYMTYTFEDKGYEAFKEEVLGLVRKLKSIGDASGIKSDGMVVCLNDKSDLMELRTDTAYDGGVYAFKVGEWSPGIYTSTIQKIVFDQQADRVSFKALIEPVRTQSGITVQTINLYNLATIVRNDLHEGGNITFRYKNETTPLLVDKSEDAFAMFGGARNAKPV